MNARLLARATAVLASIESALEDPFPAAVARLFGPPAPTGGECWADVDAQTLWPDTFTVPSLLGCGETPTTALGLCAACYAAIQQEAPSL